MKIDRKKVARKLYCLPESDFEAAAEFIEALTETDGRLAKDFFAFIGWNPQKGDPMTNDILARARAYKKLERYK